MDGKTPDSKDQHTPGQSGTPHPEKDRVTGDIPDSNDQNTPGQPGTGKEKSAESTDPALTQLETIYKVDKLAKERKFLDYQLSPFFKRLEFLKAVSGLAGVLAALFTLGTLLFTINKWYNDNEQARLTKEDERFEKAVSMLQDASAGKRLGAIIALQGFFKKGDTLKHEQGVLSLTHAIGLETDPTVRNALLEVITSTDFNKINSAILDRGLASLINLNRSLAKEIEPLSSAIADTNNLLPRAIGISRAIAIFSGRASRPRTSTILFCLKLILARSYS